MANQLYYKVEAGEYDKKNYVKSPAIQKYYDRLKCDNQRLLLLHQYFQSADRHGMHRMRGLHRALASKILVSIRVGVDDAWGRLSRPCCQFVQQAAA